MVNRKWAYRELFDSEEEAARAYDDAVWRLKPKEAKSYINFKERYSGERAPGGRLHRPRQLANLRCIAALMSDNSYASCNGQTHFAVCILIDLQIGSMFNGTDHPPSLPASISPLMVGMGMLTSAP